MFVPEIRLIPEEDGRYSVAVSIPVPNSSYQAGTVVAGAPDAHKVGAHVVACQFRLTHKKGKCPPQVCTIQQTATGIEIPEGATVTAFVMHENRLLAWNSIVRTGADTAVALEPAVPGRAGVFPGAAIAAVAARPPMTPQLAQPIVINATPSPANFKDPDQPLVQLGVTDSFQTGIHKAKIQQALQQVGFSIKQSDISSGSGVSVADCRDSVVQNAT